MKKLRSFAVVLLITAAVLTVPWLLHGCAEENGDNCAISSNQSEEELQDAYQLASGIKISVGSGELSPSYISVTPLQGQRVEKSFDLLPATLDCRFDELDINFAVLPFSVSATVFLDEETIVFSGTLSELYEFSPYESGTYTVLISAVYDNEQLQGTASYKFYIKAETLPEITVSSQTVYQGGFITVTARNVTDPKISTTLSFQPNIFYEQGEYTSFIPVGYKTKEGVYTVSVTSAELSKDFGITVEKYDFDIQHMTIDQDIADSTVNNSNADWELYTAMKPVKALCDDVLYATEDFIWPVKGKITTEFGMIRYVNGSESSSRHSGIDIAAAQGTDIVATNSGRVVLAQYLQMTGNTVVIEHGYGLKSVYYHMSELDCKVGDMVRVGQRIGKVGSTGFSTGPHLHFSMAVNTVWVNPWLFIDESERTN